MDSSNRHDRQLMRQRGAGTRNVTNPNFGLSMPFGGIREVRQQMRQRGAGNRNVDNIDFGFSFPTPSRSRRSTSRASNGSASTRHRPSKTPTRRSKEVSAAPQRQSISKGLEDARGRQESREPSTQSELEKKGSTKRRRNNTLDAVEPQLVVEQTSYDQQYSRRTPSSMFAIAEVPDEQDSISENGLEDQPDPDIEKLNSLHLEPKGDYEKENAAPVGMKPAIKRKKRKSISQQSMRKGKRGSGGSVGAVREAQIGQYRATNLTNAPLVDAVDNTLDDSRGHLEAGSILAEEADGERSKPQAKRKKKRKSVVLAKKKRRTSESVQRDSEPTETFDTSVIDDALGESGPFSGATDPTPANDGISNVQVVSLFRSIEVEDSEDEYVDDETPEPPTPAPAKKVAKPAKTGGQASKTTAKRKRNNTSGTNSSFLILTHRMTNVESLPTIQEEGDDISDLDETSHARHATAERNLPNAVDVLAQICRETVETAVEKLESVGSKGESRAVRQRKRSALEAFGADLDNRLFDISAAVEDRIDLEIQVRKVKREKTELQSRWIEVRKQRERVALRSDRVRREHWENERAREAKWSISEAARRVGLELERNPSEEEESLDFLLRTVAEQVTTSHGRGGLLNCLKGFNNQLETMAGLLEGSVG